MNFRNFRDLQNGTVVITDLNGRELISMPVQPELEWMKMPQLTSGVYLVHVMKEGSRMTTSKLVIR
ncbi:MAG: T9SS type A sorting domain-containing protein [Bacteroidia bacterium]